LPFAGLVSAAASTMATAADAGMEEIGVKGAQILLGLNLNDFARKVVLKMARNNKSAQAGQLNLAAVNMGAVSLVTQLSTELLCTGHIKEAADVTAAFWNAAEAEGMEPSVAAASASPAVVKAIDAGHAVAAANVQRLLIERGYMSLVVWLSVSVVEHCHRPDAVALGTWAALTTQGPEGLQLAADVAAMTMLEGFYQISATVGGELYDLACKEGCGDKAIEVLVLAAKQVVEILDHPEAIVAVTEILMKDENRQCLVISSLIYMVKKNLGGTGVEDAAKISLCAVRERKVQLIVQLCRGIAAQGKERLLGDIGAEMVKQTARGVFSFLKRAVCRE
jgi:hypothetical protein